MQYFLNEVIWEDMLGEWWNNVNSSLAEKKT